MNEILTLQTLIFCAVALFGSIMHVIKKWSKGEIQGTLVSWWTVNRRASVAALFAVLGSVIAAVTAGGLVDYHNGSEMMLAFTFGYIGDSSVNKQ